MSGSDTERAIDVRKSGVNEVTDDESVKTLVHGHQRVAGGPRERQSAGSRRIGLPDDLEEKPRSMEGAATGSAAQPSSTAGEATVMRISTEGKPAARQATSSRSRADDDRRDRHSRDRGETSKKSASEQKTRRDSSRDPDRRSRKNKSGKYGDRHRDRSEDRNSRDSREKAGPRSSRHRGRSEERHRHGSRSKAGRRRDEKSNQHEDREYSDESSRSASRSSSESRSRSPARGVARGTSKPGQKVTRRSTKSQSTSKPKLTDSKPTADELRKMKLGSAPLAPLRTDSKHFNPFHEFTPVKKLEIGEPDASVRKLTLGPRSSQQDFIRGLGRVEMIFVTENTKVWMTQSDRVMPRKQDMPFVPDAQYTAARDALHDLLHKEDSYLRQLNAIRWGAPVDFKELCYTVSLNGLTMAEQAALLQTALLAAGYSVRNLVPSIEHGDSPFDEWTANQWHAEVEEARAALEDFLCMHDDVVANVSKSKPVSQLITPAILNSLPERQTLDPYAMRKPVSVISSSTYSPQRISSEVSARTSFVESLKERERPRRRDRPVPGVDDEEEFFRSLGFGTADPVPARSYAQYAPVPHRPRPAAFDEPMEDAPEYEYEAPRPPMREHQRPRDVVSPPRQRTPVPNPVAPATFVPQRQPYAEPQFERSSPVQGTLPVIQAQFVPAGYLSYFYGDESLEDCAAWLADFIYTAITARWTDEEKCRNFARYVKKAALSWLRQLGSRAKKWRLLEQSFRDEFLQSTEPPLEKYLSLIQDKNESARHFLWRLNAAAKKAKVNLEDFADVERHVSRFTRALRDPVVKSKLSNVMVRSVAELDRMLRLHEIRTGSDRLDEGRGRRDRDKDRDRDARPVHRDRDRDTDRERRDRDRSTSRTRSSSAYWAYREDNGGNEYSRTYDDRSDSEDDRVVRFKLDDRSDYSDDDEGAVYKAFGQNQHAPASSRSNNHQQQWSNGNNVSSARSRYQGSNRPAPPVPTGSPSQGAPNPSVRSGQCYNCGQTGHWAHECPNRVAQPVCGTCTGPHPTESCWKKCPACGSTHEKREDCQVVRAIEDLKVWYQSPANAGSDSVLPASVLQHLQKKPLN